MKTRRNLKISLLLLTLFLPQKAITETLQVPETKSTNVILDEKLESLSVFAQKKIHTHDDYKATGIFVSEIFNNYKNSTDDVKTKISKNLEELVKTTTSVSFLAAIVIFQKEIVNLKNISKNEPSWIDMLSVNINTNARKLGLTLVNLDRKTRITLPFNQVLLLQSLSDILISQNSNSTTSDETPNNTFQIPDMNLANSNRHPTSNNTVSYKIVNDKPALEVWNDLFFMTITDLYEDISAHEANLTWDPDISYRIHNNATYLSLELKTIKANEQILNKDGKWKEVSKKFLTDYILTPERYSTSCRPLIDELLILRAKGLI